MLCRTGSDSRKSPAARHASAPSSLDRTATIAPSSRTLVDRRPIFPTTESDRLGAVRPCRTTPRVHETFQALESS